MSKEKERYCARKEFRRKTGFIQNPEFSILAPPAFLPVFCLGLILFLFSCCGCGGGGGGSTNKKSATVSGFIEGDIREGVTVTVSGNKELQTMTGADGFYLFTLPNGSYSISASMADYLPLPRSQHIVVSGRDSTNNNFLLVKDLGTSVLWSYPVGGEILSSPAIALDGTVYVGSDDSSLYAFQPTGELKWNYSTGGAIQSSPAIDQRGNIYIGSSDHRLYALNPDGQLAWFYVTGGAIQSSPAIDDLGRIYVGSSDNSLYALSPTGELRWSYKTGGEIQSSPAIDANGIVYVGSNDKNLYAISLDGKLKWKFPTRGAIKASPVIGADNTMYIGSCDHTFYAITPQGNEKWSLVSGGEIRSSCALGAPQDGTIYFGSDDRCLYALAANGSLKWIYQASSAIGSSPAIDQGNIIYFGCDDGTWYALTSTGTVSGVFQAGDGISQSGGGIHSSPGLMGCLAESGEIEGRIYFGSNDRKLYALDNPAKGAMNSPWPMFRKEGTHQGAVPLDLICSVSGKVSGVVLKGVVISLINMDRDQRPCPCGTMMPAAIGDPITTQTSEDGTFTFSDIHQGIYSISPQKAGYCFSPQTIEVTTSNPLNGGNNFTSSIMKIITISGSITGDVYAGVVLYLDGNDSEGNTIKGMITTKPNGSYEFTVHSGSYTITPSLEGYGFSPAGRQVAALNSNSYSGNDFTAYAQSGRYTLSGTVSGDIREKVTLTVSGDFSATTLSNSQGDFSFQLSNGHYFLKATKEGYTFLPAQREITIQGASCPNNNFSSTSLPYSVSGNISGDVQKGITVTLRTQGTGNIDGSASSATQGAAEAALVVAETITDDQGNFSLSVSDGSYTLTPAKAGCRFEPQSLPITIYGANRTGLRFMSVKLGGVQKWATKTGGSIYSTPALASDGTLFVGSYDDGKGYAIGPDGKIIWQFATQKHIFASPVVDQKSGSVYLGGTDNYVYAITPQGGEKWKKALPDIILSTAALDPNGTLYVGCNDGYLYALNSDSGQEKWATELEGSVSSPAVGTDGTVYVGSGEIDWINIDHSDGSFYALSTTNGQIKWKKEICVLSRPTVSAKGIIYVGSTRGSIFALDTRVAGEATVKWEYRTGGPILSSPSLDPNGTVYVGGDDARMYALNPNGTLRWSTPAKDKIRSSAAIGHDGTVYVGCNDNYLYAFDSSSGELKWRFFTSGGSITANPVIGKDGTIYVGSQNGLVYAIRGE